jgi:uncharacterized protein (DUF2236 family)
VRDAGILAIDSVARRINRESFLLLGGTAALLMQIAHPLVAAGVDQHSDFRRAPIPRLLRTVDATLAVVFGDRARAERALRRIDRIHARVRGTARDGRTYKARDARLLLWVQATLVLTSLRWYEMVMGPLSAAERESYWNEAKVFAGELGVPDHMFPSTIADLERYENAMLRSDVVPDATAISVARDVLRPLGHVPRAAYWANDAVTAGLLPASLREAFGLRYGPAERRVHRAAAVAIRIARPGLPRFITVVPQARRFERAVPCAGPGQAPGGFPLGSSDTK